MKFICKIISLLSIWAFFAVPVSYSEVLSYGSVYSEQNTFFNLNDVQLDQIIANIKQHKFALDLAIKEENIDNPKLWETIKRLTNAGITVNPWPLLTTANGYWANSGNAKIYAEYVRKLANLWTHKYKLAPTTMIVDMETSYKDSQHMADLVAKGDNLELIKFLRGKVNPAQYQEATSQYQSLVRTLHNDKSPWKVMVTAIPILLDGDKKVAEALGCVIDDVPWDKVSFQAYLTGYAASKTLKHFGGITSRLVYSYAKSTVERFGKHAAIDVGATYPASQKGFAYTDTVFKTDVQAALAAGLSPSQIHLYAVGGIYGPFSPTWSIPKEATNWEFHTTPKKPAFNLASSMVRLAGKALSAALAGAGTKGATNEIALDGALTNKYPLNTTQALEVSLAPLFLHTKQVSQ